LFVNKLLICLQLVFHTNEGSKPEKTLTLFLKLGILLQFQPQTAFSKKKAYEEQFEVGNLL